MPSNTDCAGIRSPAFDVGSEEPKVVAERATFFNRFRLAEEQRLYADRLNALWELRHVVRPQGELLSLFTGEKSKLEKAQWVDCTTDDFNVGCRVEIRLRDVTISVTALNTLIFHTYMEAGLCRDNWVEVSVKIGNSMTEPSRVAVDDLYDRVSKLVSSFADL